MVLLAVSGHEIQVDDDHLRRLCAAGAGTPVIRNCWAATTADYLPVLMLELPGGLLITRACEDAEVVPMALPWDGITSIQQVEHDWTMVVGLPDGTAVRLLFASIAELRTVAGAVTTARDAAGLLAPPRRAQPGTASRAAVSAVGAADGLHGRARMRPRPRGSHRPSPALDRIERRLASVETLLADLTTATHGRGR